MKKPAAIIEDNYLHRKLYSAILFALGYHPIEIADERNASDIVAQAQPHVLIVDIRLPHIDGRRIIEKMRLDVRSATIPILAVSAMADPDLAETCRIAGADCFLQKPIPLLLLTETISGLVKR